MTLHPTAPEPTMGELGNLHPEWVMFLQTYLTTYFTHRDLDGTLALLAPDLTGFGTGLDELGRHPQELRAMYARDLEQMQTPIACRVHWLEGRSLGPLSAVLFCVLSIEAMTENGTIAFDDLRLSLVIEKQAQGWVMVHHHLSAPTDRQESGESYPLRELRLFNEKLREEVRRKTVELEARNQSLEKALADVRTLSGLIPICASCKKIRDDKGYWNEVEEYIRAHSEAVFTHGICPTCLPKYFPKGSSR